MTHLLIGGDGFVGTGLREALRRREIKHAWTTRDRSADAPKDCMSLDLQTPLHPRSAPGYPSIYQTHPPVTHVYLVAAINKFADCEGNPVSWVVNVDAPIALARHFRTPTGPVPFEMPFIIFISSDAVEILAGTAYGRQKAQVEAYMQSIDAAIVRPGKIPAERLDEFCDLVIDVAVEKRVGVTRWQ